MAIHQRDQIKLNYSTYVNYPVYFAQGFFEQKNNVSKVLKQICWGKKLLIVVDKKVLTLYEDRIRNFFQNLDSEVHIFGLSAIESQKTLNSVTKVCDAARKFGLQRDSIIIAIGGGIIMDIVGFAAFMYRRKISYIRIPTTLVGIIDAGVGLKVGVNYRNSKNFLGGYYPPIATFNDQLFLKTLTPKEIISGLYEITKMALVKDEDLFTLIENFHSNFFKGDLNSETDKINYLAALYMMNELEQNPYESNLKRIVDFGHTFSQHIESSSGFQIPHGEAVGIDMLISAFIAQKKGLLDKEDFKRIVKLIHTIGFSKQHKLPGANELFESLEDIRSHRAGNLNLVLPVKIGYSTFTNDVSHQEIKEALKFLINTNLLA